MAHQRHVRTRGEGIDADTITASEIAAAAVRESELDMEVRRNVSVATTETSATLTTLDSVAFAVVDTREDKDIRQTSVPSGATVFYAAEVGQGAGSIDIYAFE